LSSRGFESRRPDNASVRRLILVVYIEEMCASCKSAGNNSPRMLQSETSSTMAASFLIAAMR
jgi:hypothetical protein